MKRTYYEVYYKPLSPFAVIGFILLGLAFFFLTLPIFLAALAVFSGVVAYFTWRIRKAMREMEKELVRQQQEAEAFSVKDYTVIDVTDQSDNR